MNGMARAKLTVHKPNIVGAIGQVCVCACIRLRVSVSRSFGAVACLCVSVCLSVSVSKGPPCVNLRLPVR